jgi:hypothetical protein
MRARGPLTVEDGQHIACVGHPLQDVEGGGHSVGGWIPLLDVPEDWLIGADIEAPHGGVSGHVPLEPDVPRGADLATRKHLWRDMACVRIGGNATSSPAAYTIMVVG